MENIEYQIQSLRSEMATGFAEVRSEFRTEIAEVRREMATGFVEARCEMLQNHEETRRYIAVLFEGVHARLDLFLEGPRAEREGREGLTERVEPLEEGELSARHRLALLEKR
jgi:hypothetical protein